MDIVGMKANIMVRNKQSERGFDIVKTVVVGITTGVPEGWRSRTVPMYVLLDPATGHSYSRECEHVTLYKDEER